MLPIVAIIGRPNTGKSTLFNRLIKERKAIVDDQPGVTRDRNYAVAKIENNKFILVDTGGLEPEADDEILKNIKRQAEEAIKEADLILFMADAKIGLTPTDEKIIDMLRKGNRRVLYLVNKVDGQEQEGLIGEFYRLGLSEIIPLSAAHGYGVRKLRERLLEVLPERDTKSDFMETSFPGISVVGRPNVGKSSLVNRLLGEERVVVSDKPGTTLDAIDTHFTWQDKDYLLIDTAGIRRKSKVKEGIERWTVYRALRRIERSQLVFLVLDATEGLTDQDAKIAGYIDEHKKACIILLNKWDLLKDDVGYRKFILQDTQRKLKFMEWAPILPISVISGFNIRKIMPLTEKIFAQYRKRTNTSLLNKILDELTNAHPAPLIRGKRPKFFYAAQVDIEPPTVIIVTSRPREIPSSYIRYLTKGIRKYVRLDMVPIRLIFKGRKKS